MWLLLTALLGASDVQSRLTAALALEQAGDDTRALADLETLSRDAPGSPLPHLEAGRLLLKRGERPDLARFHLDVARSLSPENPRAHFLWATWCHEHADRAEAKRALDVALLLRPAYEDARYLLAQVQLAEGAYEAAATNFRAYTAVHPEATVARLQLADALDRAGAAGSAESELKALMEAPGTRLVAGRKLVDLLERSGKSKEAAKLRDKLDPPKKPLRALKKSAR